MRKLTSFYLEHNDGSKWQEAQAQRHDSTDQEGREKAQALLQRRLRLSRLQFIILLSLIYHRTDLPSARAITGHRPIEDYLETPTLQTRNGFSPLVKRLLGFGK
jgi:hypothetical protein